MDVWEMIGYTLLNESEITDIVGTHIYHGQRPEKGDPCINYFEVSYIPLYNGVIEMPRYQISCRASEPGTAQDLARKICILFHNKKGPIGTSSVFWLQQATVEGKILLPEPETNLYHVPVDVRFVYSEATVS